ncbi:hypothetical protein ALI44B_00210 [Leifsonia sp. ALI-44-B]|uniref:hypothetical protein n=1 Tax=Leifsonia sp. ALI-44-B TaxID=1933776 RepID=UPI00097C7660|nr:hypothetical protein [Leifsonia sp. ALI-44-B]ONI65416.1 hypothetical protein ALI44B_00210 [Leifsonia sp. ALI-44-B]
MTRKAPFTLTLLAATAITLTGCVATEPMSAQTTPAVAPTTNENDDAPLAPTLDPNELTSVATAALAAYLDADSGAWFATLSPYLTDDAKVAYGTVDPANIPAAKITGEGEPEPGGHLTRRWVEVPTSVGTYTVRLERADEDSDWLVSSFGSPQ